MTLTYSSSLLRALALCALSLLAGLCGLVVAVNSHSAFVGDSLTKGWNLPRANLGKTGETTEQILSRFDKQITGHGYRRVYILAGTNDVLLHLDLESSASNLARMVYLARRHSIEPILGEIPPIYRANEGFDPDVRKLNQYIRSLGVKHQVEVIDYYSAIQGHPGFESDGVHMKGRGYLALDWALLRREILSSRLFSVLAL